MVKIVDLLKVMDEDTTVSLFDHYTGDTVLDCVSPEEALEEWADIIEEYGDYKYVSNIYPNYSRDYTDADICIDVE